MGSGTWKLLYRYENLELMLGSNILVRVPNGTTNIHLGTSMKLLCQYNNGVHIAMC